MSSADPSSLRGTARTTGLLYLGLAVTGLFGYLVIRSQIYDPDDAAQTLRQIADHEALARIGLAFEFGIVITQALVAVWFWRLFRAVDAFAAACIAAFGMVNAVLTLVAVALTGTAVQVASDAPAGAQAGASSGSVPGDPAGTVQLLFQVSTNLWGVGAIFFGLWLIPMGRCVLATGTMPRPLGRVLIVGGVGYVLSAFVTYLAPGAGLAGTLLTLPASVGEFWILGYLLIRGTGSPTLRAERDGTPVVSMP